MRGIPCGRTGQTVLRHQQEPRSTQYCAARPATRFPSIILCPLLMMSVISLSSHIAAQMKQARMLKASNAPPSTEEIAQFNIILFSSIALVIICYFSMMAMVNMVRFASPRLSLALLSRPVLIVNLVARYARRILAATRCFTLSRSPTEFDALSCARSAVLTAPQRADRCLFFAAEAAACLRSSAIKRRAGAGLCHVVVHVM